MNKLLHNCDHIIISSIIFKSKLYFTILEGAWLRIGSIAKKRIRRMMLRSQETKLLTLSINMICQNI